MKRLLKLHLQALTLFLFVFAGCKKEENKVYFKGGTEPVLAASSSDVNLSYATSQNTALSLSWTNPNYEFTTGTSALTVTYALQMDTAGSSFSNPYTITVTGDLCYTFSDSVLNDILLNQLNLRVGIMHTIETRVTASLGRLCLLFQTLLHLQQRLMPYRQKLRFLPPALCI